MIEFRTLGTIELLRPDGTALLSIVSRSKPLGLLSYLAISSPNGTRRREDVCAVMWPEVDETRARNSLNQSVHSLRRALGDKVILGGRETVGVDPSLLRCDAVEFASAIAEGSFEQALELFRGDLLPGLHIDESAEFERWLDGERQRARTGAFQAARAVSETRREAGDLPGSIAALRRARDLRPEDDDTVRELIGLLASRSNHAAAIQEFERYRQHLGSEFDLEPPEETRRLVDELKAWNGKRGSSPVGRSIDDWAKVETNLPAGPSVIESGPGRPLATVGLVAAAVLITLLFLTGGLDIIRGGAKATGSQIHPYRIAVLPLRPAETADRSAAVVLGDRLDGWAELRQVEPNRIEARIAGIEVLRAISPEEGSRLATEMGAARFLLVRSAGEGEYLNVRAVLYETGDSITLLNRVDTTGVAAGFSEDWYRDVLLRLFRGQDLGPDSDLREAEWIAEPRAMFPYFSALARFSRGESDSAISYLQQAVGIDSTFGSAWDLLAGLAMTSVPMGTDDWDTMDRLRAIRDTAQAYADLYYRQPESSPMGLARAKRVAELFPDSADLQREVATLYARAALERGFDHDSARPYWERAHELEPLLDTSAFRLLVLHLERGRLDAARKVVGRAEELGYEIPFCYFLCTFLDIVEAASKDARDSILYAAESERPFFANWAVPRILTMQDSIAIPRQVVETIGGAWFLPPTLELIAGRGSALADMELEEGRRSDWHRALANIPGLLEEPPEVLSSMPDSIVAMANRSAARGAYFSHWTWQLHKMWVLGMLSVRLEQFDQAEMWVDSMTQLAADSIAPDADPFFVHLGNDLPLEVRAAAAAARGDPEGALQLLDEVHTGDALPVFGDPVVGDDRAGQPDLQQFVPWRRPFTRFTRGRLLQELGRYEEAVGWYATFPWWIAPWDEIFFLTPAYRGRAVALDSLGRHEEALGFYRRFALRWKDADPHLQPQVEEARRRILQIETELGIRSSDRQ